ncbi:hypothetical protein RRG08_043489 [Elysia crispata]|uniref:Uncharacterized protein n=1 Tax=Elysia crispata TaxID=231223 RepID=A0AAE0YH21_9GAST|nr:hypothetical protein RRG08_043489 [Elysia crispata]
MRRCSTSFPLTGSPQDETIALPLMRSVRVGNHEDVTLLLVDPGLEPRTSRTERREAWRQQAAEAYIAKFAARNARGEFMLKLFHFLLFNSKLSQLPVTTKAFKLGFDRKADHIEKINARCLVSEHVAKITYIPRIESKKHVLGGRRKQK